MQRVHVEQNVSIAALQSEKDWRKHIKHALKNWKTPAELLRNPLSELKIVQETQRSYQLGSHAQATVEALRMVIDEGIQAMAVASESPPAGKDDPKWYDPNWRFYNIMTLFYKREKSDFWVARRIGLQDGGHYRTQKRKALDLLVTTLQKHEGFPTHQPTPLELSYPSGAISITDSFYIQRDTDHTLLHAMQMPGNTVTIRGPRQIGKTSLLIRGVHEATQQQQTRTVYLDLQGLDESSLGSLDDFLLSLGAWIIDELELEEDRLDKIWASKLGSKRKITKLLIQYILPMIGKPLMLAFDEVDRLLTTDFHDEFFGLLRFWHNQRARNIKWWQRLSILMVISTEPHLLIQDINQSPFNVGLQLTLEDFNLEEVEKMNVSYGSPLRSAELRTLMDLLQGHPYLTRLAFYTMVRERLSLGELQRQIFTEQSPFISHLRHLGHILAQNKSLVHSFKNGVLQGKSISDEAGYRLAKAGLIRKMGKTAVCRCTLYEQYFAMVL